MVLYPTKQGAVLHLTAGELAGEGLSPGGLTAVQGMELVKKAYHLAEWTLPVFPELEVYPAQEALLLCVREAALAGISAYPGVKDS